MCFRLFTLCVALALNIYPAVSNAQKTVTVETNIGNFQIELLSDDDEKRLMRDDVFIPVMPRHNAKILREAGNLAFPTYRHGSFACLILQ